MSVNERAGRMSMQPEKLAEEPGQVLLKQKFLKPVLFFQKKKKMKIKLVLKPIY